MTTTKKGTTARRDEIIAEMIRLEHLIMDTIDTDVSTKIAVKYHQLEAELETYYQDEPPPG